MGLELLSMELKRLSSMKLLLNLGDIAAHNNLAYCYQHGIGVDAKGDDKIAAKFNSAIELYILAVNQKSNNEAQRTVALDRFRLKNATNAVRRESY